MANGPDNTSSSSKVLKGGAIVTVAGLILGGIAYANSGYMFLNNFGCVVVRLTGQVCAPPATSGSDTDTEPAPPQPASPKVADLIIEVGENKQLPFQAYIFLGADELPPIYTHQKPHRITEKIPEDEYDYSMKLTFYDRSQATATPTAGTTMSASASAAGTTMSASASAAGTTMSASASASSPAMENCGAGAEISSTGEITVSDGDKFQVFLDCQEGTAFLQEMN